MSEGNMVLCRNLINHSVTQFSNQTFNSFGKIGDNDYAVGDDGVMLLGQEDGETIGALVEFPTSDLGISAAKTIWPAVISGLSDGELALTLTPEEGQAEEQTFTLGGLGDIAKHQAKVYYSREMYARFFTATLSNKDGSDFSLDRIELGVSNHGTGR